MAHPAARIQTKTQTIHKYTTQITQGSLGECCIAELCLVLKCSLLSPRSNALLLNDDQSAAPLVIIDVVSNYQSKGK
jgi:hypothetical protein